MSLLDFFQEKWDNFRTYVRTHCHLMPEEWQEVNSYFKLEGVAAFTLFNSYLLKHYKEWKVTGIIAQEMRDRFPLINMLQPPGTHEFQNIEAAGTGDEVVAKRIGAYMDCFAEVAEEAIRVRS